MQGCKLLSDIGQRPTKFRKNPITSDRTLVRRKIDLVIHTEIGKYTLNFRLLPTNNVILRYSQLL